jgi:hypothetical protein
MVNVSTNLLKNRRTLSEKDYQRERTALRYAIIGLVVVVVIVISLSAWNLFLTSKLGGIERGITAASEEMKGLAQANAQQVYLKSRLSLITDFLSSRATTRQSLQKVLSTEIPGTHISGVSFVDESLLSVQYTANESSALTELLSYYQSDTDYFTQVVSNGLTRSKEGNYQLSLALTLPKGDAKNVDQ